MDFKPVVPLNSTLYSKTINSSPAKPHIEIIVQSDGKYKEKIVNGPNYEMRDKLSRSRKN